MPETFGAKQVAARIGTDPKTLRKFLRSSASPYDAVGQGGRYDFPVEQLGEIKKNFVKWQQTKRPTTIPTSPVNGKNGAKKPETKVKVNNEILLTTPGFEGDPTPEELEDIEAEMAAHFPDEELEID